MIEIKVTQQEVNDLIFALEIAIGSGLLDRETRKDLYTLKKTILVSSGVLSEETDEEEK